MTHPHWDAPSASADSRRQQPLTATSDAPAAALPPHVLTVAALRELVNTLDADQPALDLLPVLRAVELLVEEALAEAVQAARQESASWQTVGDAVGLARQTAWKRWKPPAPEVGDDDEADPATPAGGGASDAAAADAVRSQPGRRGRRSDRQLWAEEVTVRLLRLPLPGLRLHLTHRPAAAASGSRGDDLS